MMEKLLDEREKDIEENYKYINEKIAEAAISSGRKPGDITFLAATKTVSADLINYAIRLGLRSIGENRVQELLEKYDSYDLEHCDLQFIGRLQNNKIKYIIDKVSQIQSADSISQISEISKIAEKHQKCMNILVEVNIGNESNKGGIMPEKLFEFIDEARSFKGIHVNGLMAIPPATDSESLLMQYFSSMFQYYVDIRTKKMDNISMNCLSMGMSSDYDKAILCGANMVRIGSSLFGKRDYINNN